MRFRKSGTIASLSVLVAAVIAMVTMLPILHANAATTELFETSPNIEYSGLTINSGQFAGIDYMNNVTGHAFLSESNQLLVPEIRHGVAFGVTNSSSFGVHYTHAGTYNGRSVDMYIAVDGIQTVNSYNQWWTTSKANTISSKVGSPHFVHLMTNLDQWWLLNWNGGVATARYTFSFAYSDDPSHTKIDISNAYMSCHNLVKDGGGNEFASPAAGWRGHAFKRSTDNVQIGSLYGYTAWYGTSANTGNENVTFDFKGTNIGVVIGDTVGWIGYNFDFAPLKSIYRVHYDKNADSATGTMADQSMVVDRAYNLTANAFSRTGYDWNGWNSSSNGSGTAYSNKQSVTNLMTTNGGTYTMYAQWNPHKYKIRFHKNADDATGTMADLDMTYGVEKNLTKLGFERDGYTFYRWYRDNKTDEANTYYDEHLVSNMTDEDGGIIDLYASWKPNGYIIKYAANGGQGTMPDQEMKYGTGAMLTPNAFTRAGYDFTGWRSIDKDTGKQYADNAPVNNLTSTEYEAITMYAQWTPHRYTIQFDKNRADATGTTASIDMTFDVAKTLTSNGFSSPSSTFSGWSTKADGTGTFYPDGASVINMTEDDGATVTLYAIWGDKRLTVSFIDEITNTTITSAKVAYGKSAVPPTKPYHRGYTATGWEGDYTNVTEDRTITLRYEPISYMIRFDGNGSTGGSTGEQQMRFDSEAALNANGFTRTGYAFAGWKLENKSTGTPYADRQKVTNLADTDGTTLTMYAQWTPNRYTIAYDANGGTGSMANQTMTYDVADKLHANSFTRQGYTWNGWRRDDKASGTRYAHRQEVKNLLTSGTTTMYAQWKAISYTVTTIDGVTGETIDTQTVSYGGNADEPAKPTHAGYTFESWDKPFTNITGDTVITARYRLNRYTISFDGNADGVTGSTASMNMEVNDTAMLTPNGFKRAGHDWIGWTENRDGSGKSYGDRQSVTNLATDDGATVTLYAVWRKQTRTVVFIDGLDGSVISRQTVDYGSNANAPAAPTHRGYTATGWDKEAKNVTSDMTVTMVYAPISYKVKFNGNGDDVTGMMEQQQMRYDTDATLHKNAFKKPGYHFVGWNLSADGKGGSFSDGQTVRNLTDRDGDTVNLYAMWVEDGHVAITYQVDVPNIGNEVSRDSESLNPTIGVAQGSDAIPCEAYDFKTWTDEGGAELTETKSFVPTMPKNGWIAASYVANFEQKKYNVRFVDGMTDDNLKTEIVAHGKGATAPDAPAHDGYEFIGWDREFDNVTEDITVKALYREIKKEPEVKQPEAPQSEPAPVEQPKQVVDVASDLVQTGIDISKIAIALMMSAASIAAIAVLRKRN